MLAIVGSQIMPPNALGDILKAAGDAVAYIFEHDKKQTGGVLCIANPTTGVPLFIYKFGDLTQQEFEECLFYALEKARRLAKHPDHFSSAQTRDMNADPKQYTGAVRGKTFIYSLSGCTEEQDEAAMLVTAMNVGDMDGGPAAAIAQISRNGFFRELQNACATTV